MSINKFRFYLSKYSIYIFLYCILFLSLSFVYKLLTDITLMNDNLLYQIIIIILPVLILKYCIKITPPKNKRH